MRIIGVSHAASNEKASPYCGYANLITAGIHGLEDENEDFRVSRMALSVATFALRAGRINNAVTIMAIQWLLLNKV